MFYCDLSSIPQKTKLNYSGFNYSWFLYHYPYTGHNVYMLSLSLEVLGYHSRMLLHCMFETILFIFPLQHNLWQNVIRCWSQQLKWTLIEYLQWKKKKTGIYVRDKPNKWECGTVAIPLLPSESLCLVFPIYINFLQATAPCHEK